MNYLLAAGIIVALHATSLINGMHSQTSCPSSTQNPETALFPQAAYPCNEARQQELNRASLNKLAIIHQPSVFQQKIASTNPHLMPVYKSPEIIKNTTKQISSNDQKKLMRTFYSDCLPHLHSLNTWRSIERNSDSLCSLLDQVNTLKKSGITERMLYCFAYTYKQKSWQETASNNYYSINNIRCAIVFERLRKYNKNLTAENITSPSKEQIDDYKNNINITKNDNSAYRAFYMQQTENYQHAVVAYSHGFSDKTFNRNPYSKSQDWVMCEFHRLIDDIRWALTDNYLADIDWLAKKIYDKHTKKVNVVK